MKRIFNKKVALLAIVGAASLSLMSLTNTNSYKDDLGKATLTSVEGSVASTTNVKAKPNGFWAQAWAAAKAAYKAAKVVAQFSPPPISSVASIDQMSLKQKEIKMSSLN